MSELKPCPFCGGEPVIYGGGYSQESESVGCTSCNATTHINLWNHRPAENKIKADAVRGAVEDSRLSSSDICRVECLLDYADKLEKGEIE